MAYVKGAPWTKVRGSINVSDCVTSEDVMLKSGLNFTVDKCPLVARMDIGEHNMDDIFEANDRGDLFIKGSHAYAACNNAYATFRTDNLTPLGVVKSKYEIVQNLDAFKFFDDCIGEGKAKWQTAGQFGVGGKIFVSAKLPDNIRVNGDVCDSYLLFSSTHDGSGSVNICFTPIRVVCQNTLRTAIKAATNMIKIRHTNNVHERIAMGANILGISRQMVSQTEEIYKHLAAIKVSDFEVKNYIANVFLSEQELETVDTMGHTINSLFARNAMTIQDANISMRKVNQLCDTFQYYLGGPGQAEIAGTAWGAYNAISGYFSNVDKIDGEKRMQSLIYGSKGATIQEALNILM